MNHKDFMGRGMAFPVEADPATAHIKMSEYERSVADSIRIILSTEPGERVMRGDFGCPLRRYLFQPVDHTLLTQIQNDAVAALSRFEPRIEGIETAAENPDGSTVLIHISYTVRLTNNQYSIVYPFYTTEGSRA